MASDVSTLGDLIDQMGGSVQTGPFGTKLKASEYTASGVPVISVGEVGEGRLRLHTKTPKVDESVWGRMPEYLLKTDDIVFGRKGAVERSAQVQAEEDGYFLGSDGIRVRLNSDSCHPKFIAYQLQSVAHKNWMVQHAAGTTMPSLNEGIIRRIPITFPPLPEQKAIAHILGSLDDKIELNRRMNETLEGMAQALFKSWFVDFDPVIDNALEAGNPIPEEFADRAETRRQALADFPDLGSKSSNVRKLFPDSFQTSELGPIPTGWSISAIGEEYNVVMGQSPKGDTYNEAGEGTLFFQGRAEFGWRFPTPRLYTTDPKRMAKAGDVLMSVRAPVGDFNMALNDCCVGRGLCALRHKAGGPSFTYYQMKDFQKHLDKFNGEGTVFGSINQKDLKGLKCLAPVGDTVAAFVEMVESMDSKILGNSNQILVLTQLRDTLLPKLISGELRIEDAEKMINQAKN